MVVVSHLFFFFDKKFGESVTRYESHPPSLELSISRQPPRLHYAVCVMQINGLFLSAQPEASKCRDHNTFSFHLMS